MSEIIGMFITNLIKRDPCIKCIVNPCCSEVCNESRKFNRHMGGDHTISRIAAWQLAITLFVVVPWMIITMIFK